MGAGGPPTESADFYRIVFESMREGVVVQDASGAIIACNPAAMSILGLTEDQMAGRTSLDPRWRAIRDDGTPYPGDQHPAMVTLSTGEPVRGAIMGVDAPGEGLRWISITTQPLFRSGERRPYAVIATFADITPLKRAHEERRTGEKRLQLALSSARAGIWEWDIRAQSIYWSGAVESLFGLPPGGFGGTFADYAALLHPDDRARVLERIERAVRDPEAGGQFVVEHRVLLGDGAVRWLGCAGEVERDAAGEPIMMRGTVADITARKALEAQLLQSTKMESIGALAGGVAHDFNNLLTAILTATSMAANSPEVAGTRAAELLGIVLDAANRASRLTRQLLTFARKQVVSERACSVDELVGGMRGLLQTLLGEAIALDLRLAAPSCIVHADPHQLEQLLVNLSVNAREAMSAGGRLEIETADVSDGGGAVELVIRDTGCGIEPERLERIFEPFYTTKESGSGLGLATSYGIVTKMGGTITCASEVGVGTTFRIRLPCAHGELAPEPKATAAATPGGGETILLVDDNAPARRALTLGLGALGYRVLDAGGAEEAMALVQSDASIDLVVSDVVMAGVSGPELVERIRRERSDVPVLFISGYTAGALGAAQLSGRDELLVKPFSVDALTDAIRRLLAARAR